MFCNKCGAQLEAGARFCGSCGQTVDNQPAQQPVQQGYQQPQAGQQPMYGQQPAQYAQAGYGRPAQKSGVNTKTIAIVAVIIVVVIGAIILFSSGGGGGGAGSDLIGTWEETSYMGMQITFRRNNTGAISFDGYDFLSEEFKWGIDRNGELWMEYDGDRETVHYEVRGNRLTMDGYMTFEKVR